MPIPRTDAKRQMSAPTSSSAAGFLVIDKPLGITSMDAVSAIRVKLAGGDRKAARRIKVGHAGTLDPRATGVLVLAIGSATKSINRLMNTSKRYDTTIDLSAFTSTDDLEGERIEIAVATPPDDVAIRQAAAAFTGRFQQQPPAFSAKKIDGRRAYKLARAGQPLQLEAREVIVHSLEVASYRWPMLELRIHCDKGFYVRSLARDLGKALGTGGHCTSIRRTAVGPFTMAMAHQLDALPVPLMEADLLSFESAMAMLAGAGERS